MLSNITKMTDTKRANELEELSFIRKRYNTDSLEVAFRRAAKKGEFGSLLILLKRGKVDINARGPKSRSTALLNAIRGISNIHSKLSIIEYLLDNGAKPLLTDKHNKNAIDYLNKHIEDDSIREQLIKACNKKIAAQNLVAQERKEKSEELNQGELISEARISFMRPAVYCITIDYKITLNRGTFTFNGDTRTFPASIYTISVKNPQGVLAITTNNIGNAKPGKMEIGVRISETEILCLARFFKEQGYDFGIQNLGYEKDKKTGTMLTAFAECVVLETPQPDYSKKPIKKYSGIFHAYNCPPGSLWYKTERTPEIRCDVPELKPKSGGPASK